MQSLSSLGGCSSAGHAVVGGPLQAIGEVFVAIHDVIRILSPTSHVTLLVLLVRLVFHVADDVRAALRNNGWREVGDAKLWRVRLSLRLLLLPFFSEHVVELSRSGAQIEAKALPVLRDRLALLLEEMQCLSLGVYTSRVTR